ncbi:hypothetical protein, partial [Anaerovibrio sp.]|uniref:hypothetical protein n=1 Tax=Anaerovibrio sp. TaxID=1872532 RepID=UPI0025C59F93
CQAREALHHTFKPGAKSNFRKILYYDLYRAKGDIPTEHLIRHGHPYRPRHLVSLRLGHSSALKAHRAFIHYRSAASLPKRGRQDNVYL